MYAETLAQGSSVKSNAVRQPSGLLHMVGIVIVRQGRCVQRPTSCPPQRECGRETRSFRQWKIDQMHSQNKRCWCQGRHCKGDSGPEGREPWRKPSSTSRRCIFSLTQLRVLPRRDGLDRPILPNQRPEMISRRQSGTRLADRRGVCGKGHLQASRALKRCFDTGETQPADLQTGRLGVASNPPDPP